MYISTPIPGWSDRQQLNVAAPFSQQNLSMHTYQAEKTLFFTPSSEFQKMMSKFPLQFPASAAVQRPRLRPRHTHHTTPHHTDHHKRPQSLTTSSAVKAALEVPAQKKRKSETVGFSAPRVWLRIQRGTISWGTDRYLAQHTIPRSAKAFAPGRL